MSSFKNLGRNFLAEAGISSPSPTSIADARAKVQQLVEQNGVMIFTKSYCPYCAATKSLLRRKRASFLAVDIDLARDGAALKAALTKMTGQTSVPNIFIARQHIGGNDDLQTKNKRGELDGYLDAAMLSKPQTVETVH